MSTLQEPFATPSQDAPRRVDPVSVIALILALVAVGLSLWTVFSPAQSGDGDTDFSAAQQSDAKGTTCAAADLVRRGVSLNTNLQSPGGPGDVTGSLAVAANARLSLSDGGQYLLARLDPATPIELASSAKKFADTLMDIGAAATAGSLNTDPDQAARLKDADAENARLTELCK